MDPQAIYEYLKNNTCIELDQKECKGRLVVRLLFKNPSDDSWTEATWSRVWLNLEEE